ncbi:hypothetical protein LMG19087_00738 [Ralstonia wenshanensis]|jgi:hypothetical protein|uniref:Uncharacterized protein n=1 Tax=Ralstonia wenshanensis TaxID=2842456 RepID=A0AAD2APB8_9RALS|nr:hypothetical protein LMG18091_00408 [Ralstonia wenshanensis]CAJ0810318.1 hypothetical protein LMG19087_00738 [Ralstonia wenshanensis]
MSDSAFCGAGCEAFYDSKHPACGDVAALIPLSVLSV